MAKRKPLDPYTLRYVANQLEARAELFRRFHERKGWSQRHHLTHRAAELESRAMRFRGEATMATEQTRALKPAKRTKR